MNRAITLILLIFLIATLPVAAAQTSPASLSTSTATNDRLNAAAKGEIVAKLSDALRNRYVFPVVGSTAAALVDAKLASGRYAVLDSPSALAQQLEADIGSIAHDKHMRVLSLSAPPSARVMARPRGEGGVFRADLLAGDIGYVEVLGFPPPPVFKKALDRAMKGLAGSRTLVIDVRRNGGGSPEAVAYLVSYLVAPDRPINTIVSRTENTRDYTRESYRSVPTPVNFATVPIYVLTSKETFSGGEEFAYDVQALKRGTLVGEVTGGGANPTGMVELGHGLAATIPFGRAENAVTGTNWEGRGVKPDIAVPAGDALSMALSKAGGTPVVDVSKASVKRVFSPRLSPFFGSENALRQIVAGYTTGRPDYAIMAPNVAAETRNQLPSITVAF